MFLHKKELAGVLCIPGQQERGTKGAAMYSGTMQGHTCFTHMGSTEKWGVAGTAPSSRMQDAWAALVILRWTGPQDWMILVVVGFPALSGHSFISHLCQAQCWAGRDK